MSTVTHSDLLCLTPINNRRLAELCGPANAHLKQIENHFDLEIRHKSNRFEIIGKPEAITTAIELLQQLYHETKHKTAVNSGKIYRYLNELVDDEKTTMNDTVIHTKRKPITPSGEHQKQYIDNIRNHAMSFAIGPAGTGKTYLAVACALEALAQQKVNRLIFVRPAVEAGEKLGFLPGEIEDKVLPYLRPIYDALYDMMGMDEIAKLVDQNVIELAPLAFMRGRTLNDAFIILDEAQNTTADQMQMFLTRIGFGSTAVITGDVTQVDLPDEKPSGLMHSAEVLKDVDGISFTYFSAKDAVRHPLVQSIIRAYQKYNSDK